MRAIGRFRVNRKLGEGNQGSVWLCLDPELQRPVAIKLLDRAFADTAGGAGAMQEARAISRLQHPNVVSIFDLGQQSGRPYLVFEYIDGELLSERLKRGTPAIRETLDLFAALLAGLDHVHRHGLVHRDLKPSNVIISREGVPKIMDFGIAQAVGQAGGDPSQRLGTPRYMAPEYIARGETGPRMDLFAMGAILYEMLTGQRAFTGRDQQELLERVLNTEPASPSTIDPELDPRLDGIVLKALEKQGEARYQNAGEMLTALEAYRESVAQERGEEQVAPGTVEFLLRRMRHKKEFPVLSESIRTLNRLSDTEQEDVARLSNVIIRDFALTSKILKVVNSAYYSRFAGKIGTISRAIVILGMKGIRSIAASLIFFEHIHDRTRASRLKEEIASAVFSAALARQVAEDAGMKNVEGCFLCAMLHNLGRILVTYYLDDESEEIGRLVRQEGMQPEQAQQRVLGMTFEEMGIAIARQWNFPEIITRGMVRVDPGRPGDLSEAPVKMRLISSFCNEAAQALVEAPVPGRPPALRGILKRYRMGLAISERRFEGMLEEAWRQFQDLTGSLGEGGRENRFIRRLRERVAPGAGAGEQAPAPGDEGDLTHTLILDGGERPDGAAPAAAPVGEASRDPEAVLTAGLQEASGMLLDERMEPGQLFNVVLESIYRGMAFQRVLLCLQDRERQEMVARLGFGVEGDGFMAAFRFPLRYHRDVFHAALKKGVDLHITDTLDGRVRESIPAWYRRISSAGSFLLFPLQVAGRPLGLIYADHPRANGVQILETELNLLKALRNQIVLVFRARV